MSGKTSNRTEWAKFRSDSRKISVKSTLTTKCDENSLGYSSNQHFIAKSGISGEMQQPEPMKKSGGVDTIL
jgi:hypothetical protein